jgi:hypothetical protein
MVSPRFVPTVKLTPPKGVKHGRFTGMAPHKPTVFRTSRHVRLGSRVAFGRDPINPVVEMSRNSKAAGVAKATLPTRPVLPARLKRRSDAGRAVTASSRWRRMEVDAKVVADLESSAALRPGVSARSALAWLYSA